MQAGQLFINGQEVERPCIWSERTVDGKVKRYGLPPPEKGKK